MARPKKGETPLWYKREELRVPDYLPDRTGQGRRPREYSELVLKACFQDINTDPVLSLIRDVLDPGVMSTAELAFLKIYCQLPPQRRSICEAGKVANISDSTAKKWVFKNKMADKAALFDSRSAIGQAAVTHEFGNKDKLLRRMELSDITTMLLKKFRKKVLDGYEISAIKDFVMLARLEMDMHGLSSGEGEGSEERMTDEELRLAIQDMSKGVTETDVAVLQKFAADGQSSTVSGVQGTSGDSPRVTEESPETLYSDLGAA